MKTPKRTKVCPECGVNATLQWQTSRNCFYEIYNYAVWTCPKCGWEIDIMNKAFARFHRKNHVRQLKHTITRLKASLGVEKIRSGACYSLFKKELVLAHKGKARAARWKAAAKKHMVLLQEQEADRQMLVNASLWARAWKERAKHYKNESDGYLETARNFARCWEKACKELHAHGLLQDFLKRFVKEEGGQA